MVKAGLDGLNAWTGSVIERRAVDASVLEVTGSVLADAQRLERSLDSLRGLSEALRAKLDQSVDRLRRQRGALTTVLKEKRPTTP